MVFNTIPWALKPKRAIVKFEDSITESLGYLTPKQQVENIINAGEQLYAFRHGLYSEDFDSDFGLYGDKIDGLQAQNDLVDVINQKSKTKPLESPSRSSDEEKEEVNTTENEGGTPNNIPAT